MKRLILAASLFVALYSESEALSAEDTELKSLAIYGFPSDDPKWIFETPSFETLTKKGSILFTRSDIFSLKQIGSKESEIIYFQIVFSAAGRKKFSEFMKDYSFPKLFFVFNESEVQPGIRACYGCNEIDGSLPREQFQAISALLSRTAPER